MDLQQIKEIDITHIINQYTSLYSAGIHYKAICPLHKENTASLVVYQSTNSFKCFGRGKGGSNIDFIMSKENLSCAGAIDFIKTNFGEVEKTEIIKQAPKIHIVKRVKNQLVEYWHNYLIESNRIKYFIERGLNVLTIGREMLGWDGTNYTIPIWEYQPSLSRCIGTRFRRSELSPINTPKYKGITGNNSPGFWGRWYTRTRDWMVLFAGELDAGLAVQDGLPATSLINGMGSFKALPNNWPIIYFPNVKNLLVLFDKGEELAASQVVNHWNKIKCGRYGDVIQWGLQSLNGEGDYTEFRRNYSYQDVFSMIQKQAQFQLV